MLKVNNKQNEAYDIEKLLADKMDSLSGSADCFDKITERAFPQSDLDFSESGFTVTGLENVTAKSRRKKIIRWTAAAAAVIVGIAVIPKTGILGLLGSNINRSGRNIYESAVQGIISTVSDDEGFTSMDIPLDVYSKYDVLVTPGISCPFEYSGRTDAMVRLYIRTIDGIKTNEMYAVEYSGEYTEAGFIAAAAASAEFSASDITEARQKFANSDLSYSDTAVDNAIKNNFSDDGNGILWLSGNAVSLASFSQVSLIKTEDGIQPEVCDVIYYHNGAKSSDEYFYDINISGGADEVQTEDEQNSIWQYSVYFNGRNAAPEHSQSAFTRTKLFDEEHEVNNDFPGYAYVMPLSDNNEGYGDEIKLSFIVDNYVFRGVFSTIRTPFSAEYSDLRLYFSPYFLSDFTSSESSVLNVKTSGGDLLLTAAFNDISFSREYLFIIAEELQRQIDNMNRIEVYENDPSFQSKDMEIARLEEKLDSVNKMIDRMTD